MTAGVRDEIDELVDWQLGHQVGVCTQQMISLAGVGWVPSHEEFLICAARWDPETKGWGGVTSRNNWEEVDE